jgi:subfamily B ATP-binding cassette protein MsbA
MPVPLYLLVRLGRHLRSSSETSLRRWRDISEILQETISGFRVVKAFGMEVFEIERFRRAAARLLHVNLRITRTTAFLPPLMEAVGGLALVGALFVGSYEISHGMLTPGRFVSFLTALFLMYTPVKRLSQVNATLQSALAASSRIFGVLDTHQEVREEPGALVLPRMRREIEYQAVGFRYADADGSVLRSVTFTARAGEVVAIVGTSGAGKTTLVNLLPRFYDVSDGVIRIDGIDVRRATLTSLREQIGLVTQETVLFNDTVRANIAYGLKDVDEARLEGAARAAFAHDFILDLPRRYDTVIGERGNRLSGGQRQRIAIARALLKDPPILILDEATSSLDAESERLVQEALSNLIKGRTTLVIAHRLTTVRKADRIVVLEGGEVREVGSHDELLRKPAGIYCRLHELQFRPEDPAV